MKFTDYLKEQGYPMGEATLKLANTPKVKNELFKFAKAKIDKARQRDPEVATIDKTSLVKVKEMVQEFAYALGSYTTIDMKGTMGFTGQFTSGQDAQKQKKEIKNKKELGTSIIVVNLMKELAIDTNAKNAIADFEEELTKIALKNI